MVKVTAENGEFKVEGTFDFGYMGLYKDGQIGISDSCEEVREWELLEDKLDTGSCTDEDLAVFLTDYMNALEKKIGENIRKVNNNFLYNLFDDMNSCGNEFWEHEELTVPEFMPEDPDYEEIYAGIDGMYSADDAESYIREHMPLFNMDNLIKGIKPEYVYLSDGYISFQCSDIYNFAVACGAYDELDVNDLSFTDWHNY